MLIEHTGYSDPHEVSSVLEENVFRYCNFRGFSLDGGHVASVFLACEFSGLDWYSTLFNCAVFVQAKFTDCHFRGTTFADCLFVKCEFVDCRFVENNMGSSCSAPSVRVYACSNRGGEGAEVLFNALAL